MSDYDQRRGTLAVRARRNRICFGERFSVSLQRTLRLPDDGRSYPLPPGFGAFPVHAVAAYADRVPQQWRERHGFLVPMYQREALWLQFNGAAWKPNAVLVGVGGVNAVSGEPWEADMRADPQNYVVCPDQPWLDGINTGDGTVRQFVAVDLGAGDSIEEQLTGAVEHGGLQLRVYEPRAGVFPNSPPSSSASLVESTVFEETPQSGMGIAAGGAMRQRIYPDPYGLDIWDPLTYAVALIHLVNSNQYETITGESPPPSPITARTYTDFGLPWFELYEEQRGDLPPSVRLSSVQSLRERHPQPVDEPVEVHPDRIIRLRRAAERNDKT